MPAPAKKPWDDPNYWANPVQTPQSTNQSQQQTQPQIVIPSKEEQKSMGNVPLPQNQQEMQSMINRGITDAFSKIQAQSAKIQQQASSLRTKFLNHPDWRDWADIAVNDYTGRVQSGTDSQAAYSQTVAYVRSLASQGVTVKPGYVPSPNSGANAGASYGDGSFRADEGNMKQRIGFYSEQQREEDREKYNKVRKYDQEYRKSRGELGAPMDETYVNLREDIPRI